MLVVFWPFLRGGLKFCHQQSCSAMNLIQARSPWTHWEKGKEIWLGGGGLNQIQNKFDWVEGSHPLHPIKFIGETPPPNQIYFRIWYAFSHWTVTFAIRAELGSQRKRRNFHLKLSAKRILCYLRPNWDRFQTLSGAVHDERAEWTCSWQETWDPPRIEVETLWLST